MRAHACWENNKSKHQPSTPQSYKTWPVEKECVHAFLPTAHSPPLPQPTTPSALGRAIAPCGSWPAFLTTSTLDNPTPNFASPPPTADSAQPAGIRPAKVSRIRCRLDTKSSYPIASTTSLASQHFSSIIDDIFLIAHAPATSTTTTTPPLLPALPHPGEGRPQQQWPLPRDMAIILARLSSISQVCRLITVLPKPDPTRIRYHPLFVYSLR